MLLKYFYDKALAHASYMVGCQRSGEAIIFDPARSIDQYLAAADAEGLRIVGAAETHIHADFVSGARELAHWAGATLYLSDEGTPDWNYLYAGQHSARLLKDGESFHIGKVKFEVMHTPGHTPESISFILTDEGGVGGGPSSCKARSISPVLPFNALRCTPHRASSPAPQTRCGEAARAID